MHKDTLLTPIAKNFILRCESAGLQYSVDLHQPLELVTRPVPANDDDAWRAFEPTGERLLSLQVERNGERYRVLIYATADYADASILREGGPELFHVQTYRLDRLKTAMLRLTRELTK